MDTTPIISARGLTVRYGRRLALEDVSFDVPGGAMGLLGPNGAGKSTLIRVILGFLRPERGEITVLGRKVADDPLRARQRIGYVPEVDCHIPGMSAVRYVAFCAMLCGLPREDALQRAHEMLYYVGLGEDLKPRTRQDYAAINRLHLAPAFGVKAVRDLTRFELQQHLQQKRLLHHL